MSFIDLADDFGIHSLTIGRIILESVPQSNQWIGFEPTTISWIDRDGPQSFVIPAGMYTDLASVPNLLQSVISPCGPIKDTAYMHDGLYQYRPKLANGKRVTRAYADYLLYYGCKAVAGMYSRQCEEVYIAVRIGGSSVWHSHDSKFGNTDNS